MAPLSQFNSFHICPFFSYLYKKQKRRDTKTQTHPYRTVQRLVFIILQQPKARNCHYRWCDTMITQTHRGRNSVNSWAAAAALSERYLTSFNLRVKRLRGQRAKVTLQAQVAELQRVQRHSEESWNKFTKGQFLSFFLETGACEESRGAHPERFMIRGGRIGS